MQKWLEETYPAIEEQAVREDAEILWTDEVGVEADHHPGTGYAPEGERATMEVPGPHIRVNQITAISNEGTVQFMTYPGMLTATVFLLFLSKLVAGATRKILLIADRLQGAQDARGAGVVGGAQGPDRSIFPAGLFAGDEPGGVPE